MHNSTLLSIQLFNWVSSPKVLEDVPDDIPPFQMGDFGTPGSDAIAKSSINKILRIIQQVYTITKCL